MIILRSFVIALSLYSRIPMPRIEWREEDMRFSIAFFPLVGALIGATLLLWNWLCLILGIGSLLRGAGFALLPLLIAGGIHMDGFCDTADALASNGGQEQKQAILRDPHAGVFAVISAVAYLIAFAALGSELDARLPLVGAFACVFVLSRCVSGWATVSFPTAKGSSMVSAFSDAAAKRMTQVAIGIMGLAAAGAMMGLCGIPGVAAVVAALCVFALCRFWLIGQFGGYSGDLAGWLLQMCELCCLAALVFADMILGVI